MARTRFRQFSAEIPSVLHVMRTMAGKIASGYNVSKEIACRWPFRNNGGWRHQTCFGIKRSTKKTLQRIVPHFLKKTKILACARQLQKPKISSIIKWNHFTNSTKIIRLICIKPCALFMCGTMLILKKKFIRVTCTINYTLSCPSRLLERSLPPSSEGSSA